MRSFEITTFARRFAVATPVAVLVALALPGAAGAAFAAETPVPSSSAAPTSDGGTTTPATKAPTPTKAPATKAPTPTKAATPKDDDPHVGEPGYKPWLKLVSEVPGSVTRGQVFHSRMTVSNTTKYHDMPSERIAALIRLTGANAQGKAKDVVVGYSTPGKATQNLKVTETDDGLLLSIDLPGPLRAGKSITVDLSVTVNGSATHLTDGSIEPWLVKVPDQDPFPHRFKIGGAAKPADDKDANVGTRPVADKQNPPREAAAPLTELPKTGSATAVPLTLAGGALVLLGAGAIAVVRRRNTA
ncbi:LPXTG cell wall anchor domain-containing protein [Embleya sp. NPDC020630]|uniref:LPXTG cell wall anchor domain-containing protein n=1 Tax=Embleya sp. NPDC020630 TaxID=3363979 RepID=UPI003795667D